MRSIKKVECAVLIAFVAVNLHGCLEQAKQWVKDKYNEGLTNICEQIVAGHVDEAIMTAYRNLETNCTNANPDQALKVECMGKGVSYLMSTEKIALANYTKMCVDTVNGAGADLGKLYQSAADWWGENKDGIQKGIQDQFSKAKDAVGEAVSQGKDATIVFMCEKMSEAEIDKMILEAKNSLVSQCQNSSVSDHIGCQEAGDQVLNDVAVAEVAKWAAECETNLRSALSFDSIDHLTKHLDDWWNTDGQKLRDEVIKMANDAISSAKDSYTATSRLYDAATSHVDPPPQKPNVSTIVAAAGSIGLVTMLVGAFVVRLFRSHPNARRDVEQVAVDEEEIE